MTAEVLDKLFTARVSGPRMAMSGKLSFTGDTLLAMSMRRIQKSLERCYAEARAASGMTDEILAGSGAPAPAAAAPAPVEEGDEREALVKTLEELFAAGVITSTGGNVSVRVAGEAERVWITPNQLHKGRLSPDMLVKVDLDGNPVAPGPRAPSSERLIHCSILRQNPQAGAVIHSHAPKATTLALTELPFLPISTEAAFIGEIPRIPFMMPGTPDLATAVAKAIGSGPAVLMQNHGLVVAGADLHHAAMLTLVIEQTADKLLACHALGKAPPVLPDELVRSLRELGEMLA